MENFARDTGNTVYPDQDPGSWRKKQLLTAAAFCISEDIPFSSLKTPHCRGALVCVIVKNLRNVDESSEKWYNVGTKVHEVSL